MKLNTRCTACCPAVRSLTPPLSVCRRSTDPANVAFTYSFTPSTKLCLPRRCFPSRPLSLSPPSSFSTLFLSLFLLVLPQGSGVHRVSRPWSLGVRQGLLGLCCCGLHSYYILLFLHLVLSLLSICISKICQPPFSCFCLGFVKESANMVGYLQLFLTQILFFLPSVWMLVTLSSL